MLAIFLTGCTAASTTVPVSQGDNDVLILSMFVQDLLRKTDARDIDLAKLIQMDSAARISDSFENVMLKYKGGHISIYFTFAKTRIPGKIALTEKEKERAKFVRWQQKKRKGNIDGEIQLDYGERFYRIIRIVRNANLTTEKSI